MTLTTRMVVPRETEDARSALMIATPTKPIRRAYAPVHGRAVEGGRVAGYDPADFGAALRDVAVRAHRAVRAIDAATGRGDLATPAADPLQELADLHPRIVELQCCVEAETQGGLASYLSALRREVETRLG
jgi:hypothetical protein